MITATKQVKKALSTELSPAVLGWLETNAESVHKRFSAKFPRSRNLFNAELLNKDGSKRVLVVNGQGKATLHKTHYRNVITLGSLKKMGCPSN